MTQLYAKNQELEKKCHLRKNYIKKIYQIIEVSEKTSDLQKKKIFEKFAEFYLMIEEKILSFNKVFEDKIKEATSKCSNLVRKVERSRKPIF